MLGRYMADPLEGLRVELDFHGKKEVVVSGHDGYFEKAVHFDQPIETNGWLEARYTVLDKIVEGQEKLVSKAGVYVLDERCEYGVISDVDDTILVSYATAMWKKLRLILTKNSRTRLPFPGIAGFYRALEDGINQQYKNPIFYVSSSEWNLYDFLVDFCAYRGIPKGPFLLQDYKKSLGQLLRSGGGNHEHKLHKIRHLFDTFPDLKFILLGDSGQRDPAIYAQIVKEYPARVMAIYIRDVSRKNKRAKVLEISDSLRPSNVDMLLVADTLKAAAHAFDKGFITENGLKKVALAMKEEQ